MANIDLHITKEQWDSLTELEKTYVGVLLSKNVLFLVGPPGMAKSAIGNAIAKKIGVQYIDVRLSQKDSIDIGGFPYLSETGMTDEQLSKQLSYATPDWAIKANSMPCIIHFEELNRSSKAVRDAALQILNERMIGSFFSFKENVMLMASGNIGTADATDVDDLDAAVMGRICTIKHHLSLKQWREAWANDNVWSVILDYLQANEDDYYAAEIPEGEPFTSPRSWTNLSNYCKKMICIYSDDPNAFILKSEKNKNSLQCEATSDILNKLAQDMFIVGAGLVGSSAATRFANYLRTYQTRLTLQQVINEWDKYKNKIKSSDEQFRMEILQRFEDEQEKLSDATLENVDIPETEDIKQIENAMPRFPHFANTLNENQLENYMEFLETINEDRVKLHLLKMLEIEKSPSEDYSGNMEILGKRFKNILQAYVEAEEKKSE